jgi:hypothetical protein
MTWRNLHKRHRRATRVKSIDELVNEVLPKLAEALVERFFVALRRALGQGG